MFARNFSSSVFVLILPFLAPAVAACRSGLGDGGNIFAVIIIMRTWCNSATNQSNLDGIYPLRNSYLGKLGKEAVLLMGRRILMDARIN